ncbi:response regulator transcription factor [Streptococcus thoraltensis]
MEKRVLIVDDEPHILTLVSYHLAKEGFDVTTVEDGRSALGLGQTQNFDFIVLDIMLPQLDGVEVCKRLRKAGVETPILMLSAKGEEFDKVLALELGADDYMTKPFSPRELLARIKAILRRTEQDKVYKLPLEEVPVDTKIQVADLEVYLERHQIFKADQEINLTPKEFELLVYLLKHPRMTLTRERLLERIWGYDFGQETRLVDVHIGKLREKIEDNPKLPQIIKTVRGYGYKFEGEN